MAHDTLSDRRGARGLGSLGRRRDMGAALAQRPRALRARVAHKKHFGSGMGRAAKARSKGGGKGALGFSDAARTRALGPKTATHAARCAELRKCPLRSCACTASA